MFLLLWSGIRLDALLADETRDKSNEDQMVSKYVTETKYISEDVVGQVCTC